MVGNSEYVSHVFHHNKRRHIVLLGMLRTFPQSNFSLEFPEILKSKSCIMLSLTECVRDFQNSALWDTHEHTLLKFNLQ